MHFMPELLNFGFAQPHRLTLLMSKPEIVCISLLVLFAVCNVEIVKR